MTSGSLLAFEALEFIPNSVRLWKEAVSLEARRPPKSFNGTRMRRRLG